jgi:hypothetical protein
MGEVVMEVATAVGKWEEVRCGGAKAEEVTVEEG